MNNQAEKRISIAVLPFRNLNTDGENEFFCDGITEEIIDALAQIDSLRVISRSSSFFFKNHRTTIQDIAEKLQVSNLLEGSVKIADSMMRIKAQLVNVHTDEIFWTKTWERKKENIFDIQDEISLLIADSLREHFGHMVIGDHLVKSATNNPSAYEHQLRGKHHFYKWNPEDTNKAIFHFEEAVKLDGQLIDVHLGLADAYSFMAVAGFAPREEAWKKASEAIQEVKIIDPNNKRLNYMLANQSFFTEANYKGAMKYILRSLATGPTYSEAHQFLCFLYILKGEMTKAKEHLYFAKSIDPLNPETKFYEAYFLYRSHEYDGALYILEELLEANDKNLPALIVRIYILIRQDRLDDALKELREVNVEMLTPDERLGMNALIDSLKGHPENLLKELEEKAKEPTAHHAHAYIFMIYANLGMNDKAFGILGQVFESNSSILLLTFNDPLASKIQEDNRWKEYHARLYPTEVERAKSKVSKSVQLDEGATLERVDKLALFVETERPFLNPTLSLRSLAEQIEIHPNQLSWLLNESIGKNFNEYINSHRIAHFKKLILDPSNSHISIIGLAYESGFNSKTVFNTTFKKIIGMTPKEYQKSQQ